ncbi:MULTISPECIES: DUF4190 domain-containing protein [unclassified Brevibacterium]|uniref:DUF4190 domain-containing protein n=1 Tax=unclassified Brevibacterium TaxID=2614124 RepID=UPI001092FFD2|nr:DUF4190 domain-containing protein [Brevibacterium sp. S22]TGD32419.1 DUF4352 domain-containing protein [Brevibacterium sp. S22]
MSTPQNPYGSGDGSPDNPNGQNPNNQPPSAPDYGNDPNSGQQPPQYGSQPNYGQGGNDGAQGQQPPQYGSQPNYGQPNDQNQYGSQPNYGAPNDPYGQNHYGDNQGQYGAPNDPYGQNPYDANAQGYDANQYGQQPAYAGADGSSDQFIPANPNAAYGQYPSGSGGNTSKNIWGILALIGGIVGILGAFVFGGGALFGIAAVIFGFVGLSAVKKGLANNKGLNITGIILGIVSVVISIVVIVATIMFGAFIFKAADEAASSSASPGSSQGAGQDPSQGSNGGDAAPAQAGEVEIGDDVTAMINVAPGTASSSASGAESTNGEIAVVTMTVKNDSSADVKMTLTDLAATDGGGKEYQDVIDGTDYKGVLSFTDPVPAGGEMTYKLAYGVPKAEIDDMHLKLELIEDLGKGKDFEFYKQ